jgi:glycine hydroxymethyltransferase
MVKIGKLISKVLRAPDDEKVISEVRKEVQELCDAFPLYQERYDSMRRLL